MALPTRFTIDRTQPAPVQALSLTMALMRVFKTPTWRELVELATGNPQWPLPAVRLTAREVELIDGHADYAMLLRITDDVTITVAVCDKCGTPQAVPTGATVSKSCLADPACVGSPLKVKPASRMQAWDNGYLTVTDHFADTGELPEPSDEVNGGVWLENQRKAAASNKLEQGRRDVLDANLPGWLEEDDGLF